MKPIVHAYFLCYNEEHILPHLLDYYLQFCEKIYNFDFGYDLPFFHRDECYLGKKINRNHNEINIVKLKRGIENVWNYPRRINKEKRRFYCRKNIWSNRN